MKKLLSSCVDRLDIASAASLGACAIVVMTGMGFQTKLPRVLSVVHAAEAAEMDWKTKWEETVNKAREEGKVVYLGPPTKGLRPSLIQGFQKAFPGITLDFQVGSLSRLASRLRAELQSGKTSIDISMRGASGFLHNKDLLQPLPPKLMLPEAIDPDKWKSSVGRGLKWNDRNKELVIQTTEWVFGYLLVNTRYVKSGEITSWKDLLKPKWKGKIASHDPRGGGPGSAVATYLMLKLGEDFVVDLFRGQEVALTRNRYQVADWAAQGKYPIGMAQVADRIEALRREGVPLDVLQLSDAPGYLTGGFGSIAMMKGGPHPNATTVFLNWILTQEGQEAFNRPVETPSLRVDVPRDFVAEYIFPKPGVDYIDGYTEDYVLNKEPKLSKKIQELIGR